MNRTPPIVRVVFAVAAICCASGVRPVMGVYPSEQQEAASGAENFPTARVRLIEPFGAGGGPDLIARVIGPPLSRLWGQPVVVENRQGAGATAAPALVAASQPDGYTLLVNTSAQVYAAALRKNLPYNPLTDFTPVASLTSQPYVLVVGRDRPFRTVAELIAAAKAAPGKLRFASTGIGTGTHLGVEKLNLDAGIRSMHVPAGPGEGIAEVVAATVAGRADYQLAPIDFVLPYIRSGELLALGVTTGQRSLLLPDVPTIAEAGVRDFDFPIWYGVWAPAGTPQDTIAKLSRDIAGALAVPEVRSALMLHGAQPLNMTQPEFARFVVTESKKAAMIANAAGLSPQ